MQVISPSLPRDKEPYISIKPSPILIQTLLDNIDPDRGPFFVNAHRFPATITGIYGATVAGVPFKLVDWVEMNRSCSEQQRFLLRVRRLKANR